MKRHPTLMTGQVAPDKNRGSIGKYGRTINRGPKRGFALLRLALLLLVIPLAGCEDVADIANLVLATEEPTPPAVYVVSTPEMSFPPETSTAARIEARGHLVVGVRYDLEPFSYIDASGLLSGLEIDLARELASRWLGDPEAVVFRQVRSDTALQYLTDGSIDIALAGIAHTQESEALADFSPSYFTNGYALLTFPDTGIQTTDNLEGRTIGVVGWTESGGAIQASTSVSHTMVAYENFFEVIEALRVRQIDAYGDMRHRLERARRLVTGTTIVGQFSREPVALVYRQDDPFFANLVALTFQDMVADGTRDALFARWLPGTSPPEIRRWPGAAPAPALGATPPQLETLDVRARIAARGTLAVGYFIDRWPYSSDRADGVPTGFEVRLMERFAERWLGDRQAITFVPITEADAYAKLIQGEVDILVGNWLRTREAELQADFSIPIYDDGVSLFSLGSAPVPTLGELGGRPVGVITGSPGEAALPSISQAAGLAIPSTAYPDLDSAVNGLLQGEVAAILNARRDLLAIFYNQQGFFMSDTRYTTRPVCYVLPQGDSAFRDMVNATLAVFQTNGTYQELYSVWFVDAVPRLDVPPGQTTLTLRITTP